MKLLVERDAAVKALAHVTGVVNAKHSIPILCNIKLEAGATSLTLTANNLDQQAVDSVAAKVEQPGAVTVEAKRLLDMFKAFPAGGEVSLSVSAEDQRLIVRCGKTRSKLAMLPPEDFPQFASLEHGRGGAIERDALKRLFQRTRFACGNNETYIAEIAVYLHVVDKGGEPWLTAAATDRNRLAVADMRAPEGFEGFGPVLIPAGAVDEFLRLLGDAPDVVELRATDSLVELRAGDCDVTSKLVDGGYYEYWRAFPSEPGIVVPLDVDLMGAVIARASLASDDKYRTLRVGLSEDLLSLSARTEQGACEVTDTLDITYPSGPFEMHFNARFMRDAFQVITGETALVTVANDPRAAPLLIHDSKDPDCRYLLMPQKRAAS